MSTNLMKLIRDLTKRVDDLTLQVEELQAKIDNKPNKRKKKKLSNNSHESDESILLELSQTYKDYLVVDEEDGTLDVHWGKLQDRVGRQIVGNREEEVKWGFPILNQGKSLSDEDMRNFKSEIRGL